MFEYTRIVETIDPRHRTSIQSRVMSPTTLEKMITVAFVSIANGEPLEFEKRVRVRVRPT